MDNLITILSNIKTLGCSGVKISFEDEGALINELMTMRYITACANIELSVKIGGCEDKRSIHDCIHLQCNTIVSPMIESSFALNKYISSLEMCKYDGKRSFNLETNYGYSNMNEIKEVWKKMNSITVGRVDFVSSINKDRTFVNSPYMYNMVENVFTEAKKDGLFCNLGGAISIDSKEFIMKLIEKNILDYFETRYIIFEVCNVDMNNFEKMLYYANLFEVEWLKFISNRYSDYASKDTKRIQMIQERLDKNIIY